MRTVLRNTNESKYKVRISTRSPKISLTRIKGRVNVFILNVQKSRMERIGTASREYKRLARIFFMSSPYIFKIYFHTDSIT